MNWEHVEAVYPLTPAQTDALAAAPRVAWLTGEVHGELAPERFAQAWQQVCQRHAALRSVFVWQRVQTPRQVVYRQAPSPLNWHDLTALSPVEQAARVAAWLAQAQARGCNPARGPLVELALWQLTPTRTRMTASFAPLACDARSLWAALGETLQVYAGTASEPASDGFAAYHAWLKEQPAAAWSAPPQLETVAAFASASSLLPEVVQSEAVQSEAVQPEAAAFATHARSVAAAQWQRWQAAAQSYKLELATFVCAAWALLAARYDEAVAVVLGVHRDGRPSRWPNAAPLLGSFSQWLPLSVACPPEATVAAWLTDCAAEEAAQAQQLAPTPAQWRAWLNVAADAPLFTAGFDWETWPVWLAPALTLTFAEQQVAPPCSLQLCGREPQTASDELRLQLHFDAQRYERAAVARQLEHLLTLLDALATQPETQLGALPYLPAAELQQLLLDWNATARPFADSISIAAAFAAMAQQQPDAVALSSSAQNWTYAELDARANQLAHCLRGLGVGPEVLVGVCLPRSFETVLAWLAVLKAGGAFLPLDPQYPLDRLAFMFDDAQVAALITQETLLERLPVTWAPTLCLDSSAEALAGFSRAPLSVAVQPDNLAYVIYTSGSTGRPKGVQVAQRGVLNLAAAQSRAFECGPGSRVLQFASLSFDAAVSEVFVTLLSGATLVLATDEALQTEVGAVIQTQAVTLVTLPPALLSVLPPADWPTLQTLVVAGEACPAAVAAHWGRGHRFSRRFINAYGPTETTVCATLCVGAPAHGAPPIGGPLENTRVYVLDAQMQPVGVGVRGELYVAGVGLARGYLKRPGLTAERFVPDPFAAEPGGRLYRTGDFVRWLPSGALAYLGRRDAQVKVRGFRIELGEIEAALRAYPGVQECVVLARPAASGQAQLLAYLLAAPEIPAAELKAALAPGLLKDFLRRRLPEYMLPAHFVTLSEFPLNHSGKIDRARLPEPTEVATPALTLVAPRTATEQQLAALWAELLRLEQVSADANFFELGGHSLLATQLVARVRAGFEIELPVSAVFNAPTLAALAALIEQAQAAARSLAPAPAEPTPPAAPLRATARTAQRRAQVLAALDQLSEDEAQALLRRKTAT